MKADEMHNRPRLHERAGNFYFRAKVPPDLLPFYTGKEVKFSLRTRDRLKAWQLVQIESVRLDAEFAKHRATMGLGAPCELILLTSIDDAFVKGLCAAFLRDTLESDIALRTSGFGDVVHSVRAEDQIDQVRLLSKSLAMGQTEVIEPLLQVFLRTSGFELRVSDADHKRLAYAFLQTYIKAKKSIQQRDDGEIVETDELAPMTSVLVTPVQVPVLPKLSWQEIFSHWAKAATRRPKTADEFKRILDSLAAFHPAKTPEAIGKKDLIAFRDHLLLTQQGKTVDKKISILRTIFKQSVRDDILPIDPTEGVLVSLPKTSKKTRVAFTLDDLNTIFGSDFVLQKDTAWHTFGAAVFWLPLIALYTGARIEEIAQLRASELKEAEGLGYFFDITDEGEDSELKNAASRRRVPLHPELVRVGLVDYAKSVDPAGYLFPDLRADKYQRRSSAFSKAFNRNMRVVMGVDDKRKVFHSFRHLFKHQARELGIAEDVHDALTGHSSSSEARRYGNDQYPLAPLFNAVKAFNVAGLKPVAAYVASDAAARPASKKSRRRSAP